MKYFWELFGVLAAVILILILAYYATKWIGKHGGMAGGTMSVRADGAEKFRVLAQLTVGRNERLLLVRLEEKCFLLGVTEHGITMLRELEEDEASKWLDADALAAPPSFIEALGEALRRKK